MSISDKKQNLDQAFRPDYGCDDNGIQYSCGHINPLQRALVNNGVAKLNSIKDENGNIIPKQKDLHKIIEISRNRHLAFQDIKKQQEDIDEN